MAVSKKVKAHYPSFLELDEISLDESKNTLAEPVKEPVKEPVDVDDMLDDCFDDMDDMLLGKFF